jgi:hypothetical protein
VPLSIAALPDFQFGIQINKQCPGRTVRTIDDLEAVRFCTVISGQLTIEINDADADFTALLDLEYLQGLSISFSIFVSLALLHRRSSSPPLFFIVLLIGIHFLLSYSPSSSLPFVFLSDSSYPLLFFLFRDLPYFHCLFFFFLSDTDLSGCLDFLCFYNSD